VSHRRDGRARTAAIAARPFLLRVSELRTARPSSYESLLLALDSEGNIAWAQPLPLAPRLLAVSASGRIAVASEFLDFPVATRTSFHVREYDAQGHLRWSRTWSPADASGAVSVRGMAWSSEELVLAGAFRGAVDFGTGVQQGPTEPHRAAGYVLKLR
jgi:hypothetical protein